MAFIIYPVHTVQVGILPKSQYGFYSGRILCIYITHIVVLCQSLMLGTFDATYMHGSHTQSTWILV